MATGSEVPESGTITGLHAGRPAGGFIRPYQREFLVLARVFDLLWITMALWAGLEFHSYPWEPRYTILISISSLIFLFASEIFQVYRASRTDPIRAELTAVLRAWGSSFVSVLILGYAFKITHEYSRLAVGTWFLLAPALLLVWRGIIRRVSASVRVRGYNSRRVAVVGTGSEGISIARTILDSPWLGLRLLGIYDDRALSDRIPPNLPAPILGTTRDLLEKVQMGKVDIVYVTSLPMSDKERVIALLEKLSDSTVSVYIVPDMFLFNMFHGSWVQIGSLPAVSVVETPFYGVEGWVKRLEDILISGALITLFAVPMAVIALAVKLTSKGPVLFRQRRYGLDGEEFKIWKFRTMTTMDDGDDVPQATTEDARLTPIGALLRRTSLDELPQFFNVLGGTMSVVGPRPHATSHNEYYRRIVKGYMIRHKVRPGITGWAQANGWRGETETVQKMETRVEYDLWYIRNWSVLLDLKIIWMTALTEWRGENAY